MTRTLAPAWTRDRGLVATLVFLVTMLVYLPAMSGGGFHFDDMHSIVENPGVRSLADIPRFFVNPQLWSAEPGNCMYRPVLLTTFALDYSIWGYAASGWLMTNALIHAGVAVLVHRLALRLGLCDLAALFAAAVFALHPALSEVQNYASSRSESLAALLMLVALHAYLSARGARGPMGLAMLIVAGLVSALAVLAKETTAGLAVAVVWMEILQRRRAGTVAAANEPPAGLGRAQMAAIGSVALLVGLSVALLLRRQMLGNAVADLTIVGTAPGADVQVGGGRSVATNLLTQSRVVVLYLQTLVRPVGLNIDHDVAVVQTVTASVVAACAIHVAIAAAALRAAWRGARLFPLCVGWFWIFLAPSVVVPLNVVMNEHRLYLPMIAVALLAGAALARVAELLGRRTGSSALGLAIAGAPLVAFVPLVVQRSREWRDDETLWSVAVERAPNSARAHMHFGAVSHDKANRTFEQGERVRLLDIALAQYATSAELHAGWADVQLNIGNARLSRGRALRNRADFEASLAAFKEFGDIVGPAAPRPRMLQAAAYAELGEVDRAIDMVRELRREDPAAATRIYDDAIAHYLRRKGDKAGAREAMERVIAVDAADQRVDGLLDLGWWCFEDGDVNGAERYLGRAFDLAKKTGDKRPPLYIARFLNLIGQPGAEKFIADARALQWTAPPEEVRWVMGGATPGVFTGTVPRGPR